MAHKKAAGSAKNLRDSNAKYRGVKLFGGQLAKAGNIIVRQKGDKFQVGKNVYKGNDFTIHAMIDGIVSFRKKNISKYNGRVYLKTVVEVLPIGETPTPKTTSKQKVVSKPTTSTSSATPAEKTKKPVAEKKATTKKSPTEKKTPATKKATATKSTTKKATPTKTTTKKEISTDA